MSSLTCQQLVETLPVGVARLGIVFSLVHIHVLWSWGGEGRGGKGRGGEGRGGEGRGGEGRGGRSKWMQSHSRETMRPSYSR